MDLPRSPAQSTAQRTQAAAPRRCRSLLALAPKHDLVERLPLPASRAGRPSVVYLKGKPRDWKGNFKLLGRKPSQRSDQPRFGRSPGVGNAILLQL